MIVPKTLVTSSRAPAGPIAVADRAREIAAGAIRDLRARAPIGKGYAICLT
jgi:hypothetical protein